MKPFIRKKGKYKDGRSRYVIEDRKKEISIALPKPEILIEILRNLGSPKSMSKKTQENHV